MTGFAYDGSQYDAATWDAAGDPPTNIYLEGGNQYDAGHWDADSARGAYWVIAGQRIRVVDVVLTPTRLEVEVRARDASARAMLATLDADAGSVDTRERADGTTAGLDTSGDSNTYTVRPSTRLRPPRVERQWLVKRVERDRTSADTQALAGTIEFVAQDTRPRDATNYTDTGAASDEWVFDFQGAAAAGGTLITKRVSNISQGDTTTVTLVLDRYEAEVLETVAAAAAGAVVTDVPDGATFVEDTTPNSRQTVAVTPPSDAADPAIDAGDYVVTGWESQGTSEALRVTLEIDEVGA